MKPFWQYWFEVMGIGILIILGCILFGYLCVFLGGEIVLLSMGFFHYYCNDCFWLVGNRR